ncbi:pyrroloquinoline quinone biosynthesis protein PqqE [Dongia deserti]|uniref:pyrroloquinoline quinone biosynthesis protein PqqE n=1 Tax=Dongia deserti TaxID=2268030 RepID=UPI000E64FA4B|nr:pyrroloquinoline quinone biosynthesis protein PqqE [Dongia deserti]
MSAPGIPAPPLAALLELTHRCPLQCPYCSNPLELERAKNELSAAEWTRVLDEAAELGILQVHFSGGEPAVRRDLPDLVAHAREIGLYSNLITSGVTLDQARIAKLADAGLDHVQLSIQDVDHQTAAFIANYPGVQGKKLAFARMVREAGLPLTINAVINRHNITRVERMIDLAVSLGASRVEVAHAQYYGWAIRNRAALMPTLAQVREATERVEAARGRLRGQIVIDHVVPDYYARQPKACMGGWGRQFLNITPSGEVLPCHAAQTIPGLTFESVRHKPLAEIWASSKAFERFRGTDWMPEPCRSCDQREVDWGGCRCQALAITGNAAATDPACALSSAHDSLRALADTASSEPPPDFVYRRMTPHDDKTALAAATS